MGLGDRVSAERLHIGFFGMRNAGKSSVVNRVTGQNLSLVSDVKGTTTDPVQKAMEILPIGPVVIIDTPGMDDVGELGKMRVERTLRVLDKTDIAVLIVDADVGIQQADRELCDLFKSKNIPYIVAFNKSDVLTDLPSPDDNTIYVSAKENYNIYELKEMIGRLADSAKEERPLISDLIAPGDVVVLVTPIDAAAPKGRMILPQQQMMRAVLDCGGINIVTQTARLGDALDNLKTPPKMVITDSQAFGAVSRIVPPDVLLTSFSILFARYKGDLRQMVRGAAAFDKLRDGGSVLISEGCTHHRQCGDIGTQKLPRWIEEYTGKKLYFSFTSGGEFPTDLSKYDLVVHCGGCMLGEREMLSRINRCAEQNVPVTNYGTAIAQLHGILRRALSPFPDIINEDLPLRRTEQ